MSKKKSKYLKTDQYGDFLQDIKRRGMTFELHKTNYSRRIKFDNKSSVHFNKDGKGDDRILGLINRVRNDAAEYMAQKYEQRQQYINWYDLIKIPQEEEIVTKIDIRGAYWNAAIKMGVISENTNQLLLQSYKNESAEKLKSARLKALGSLATRKEILYYKNGVSIKYPEGHEFEGLPYKECTVELTRDLYLDICREVDIFMKEISREFEQVFYYYWDCIFAHASISQDIIKFIKNRGYDVKTEQTKLSYIPIGNHAQILSTSDDKMYCVPREKKALLESYINKQL